MTMGGRSTAPLHGSVLPAILGPLQADATRPGGFFYLSQPAHWSLSWCGRAAPAEQTKNNLTLVGTTGLVGPKRFPLYQLTHAFFCMFINHLQRRSPMRNKSVFSIIVIVALLTAGSGIAVAEELALLTWKGYAPVNLVEKFQKETGITVKVTFSNNEEMIAKLGQPAGPDSTWRSPVRTGSRPFNNSTRSISPLTWPRSMPMRSSLNLPASTCINWSRTCWSYSPARALPKVSKWAR